LIADSGFRSISYQRRIIKNRLAAGEKMEHILKSVAPPGYSQHHTGRSLDLCPSEARFAHTKTYRWLVEHAAACGFRETIPNNPAYPGTWESWHWTYVGDLDSAAVKNFLR
jgi:D-alanyl-D-alanine carboxypeptidase